MTAVDQLIKKQFKVHTFSEALIQVQKRKAMVHHLSLFLKKK